MSSSTRRLQQLARARAGESEDAVALGYVVELHRAVVRRDATRARRSRAAPWPPRRRRRSAPARYASSSGRTRFRRRACTSASARSARPPGGGWHRDDSRNASAPGPETLNLAKLVWSSTPTAERTARHSSPTASNQLPRRNEYSSRSPPGENHSGRSQPNRRPITAPRSDSTSYRGSVFSGRPASRSSSG